MRIGITYDTPEMYDFAFSFAGEDRKLVNSVKKELIKQNYTVFYDNDLQHNLLGKDLYSYLREMYKNKCKFVVCFISKNYAEKVWTTLEFTAVKERLMSTFFASDFLIPILIDDSPMLEDIPSFIGFYKFKNLKETVNLLSNKFDRYIIEDNYLSNINNCINYICHEVCVSLHNKGCLAKLFNSTILITKNNVEHRFKFASENEFNIPSILIFYQSAHHPELFISWSKRCTLTFNLHYFNQLKATSENLGIKQLIEALTNYIINHLEY